MAAFFPTNTATWKVEDRHHFRRISMSVVEMAAITGVLLRLYRAMVLSQGSAGGWLFLAITFSIGFVILFGMVTLHLGNFTVRRWVWRVPVFAAVEAAAESLTSLVLILLAREPLGTTRATIDDWPSMVAAIIGWRVTVIVLFSLLLAGVVQASRYLLLRREHREHTFRAVHQTAEHKGGG
jgi:hypothetical protein